MHFKFLLNQKWDPNDNIKIMMMEKTDIFQEIAALDGIALYTTADFIHYCYMAVWHSNLFTKDCIEWKHKPAANRTTEQPFRTFLGDKYNSYAVMGIANSVRLQQQVNNNQKALRDMKQEIPRPTRQTRARTTVLSTHPTYMIS